VIRTVQVGAGGSASVFALFDADGGTAPGTVAGFIALSATVRDAGVRSGRLIGTTRSERLVLPVGRHQLELVNDAAAVPSPPSRST
jgi:hypothetical protein